MTNIILLDVDGVVCNFVQGVIDSLGANITHDEYATWDYHKEVGFTDEQLWAPTREAGWWESLQPYPWAGELLELLRSGGSKIVFCTSPGPDHKCASEKIFWLRKHGFMDQFKNDFQIGPMKELNAMSGALLIDDSDSNVIKYVENAGRAILFPQPWNAARVSMDDRTGHIMSGLAVANMASLFRRKG